MEENYLWVLENIRSVRKRKGMTQSEIAKRTGLSNSQYSLLENGKQQPGIGTLIRVAKGLEVEVGDFFAKEGQNDGSLSGKVKQIENLPEKDRSAIEAMIDIILQKEMKN